MKRTRSSMAVLSLCLAAFVPIHGLAAPGDTGDVQRFAASRPIADRYIVLFRDDVVNPQVEAADIVRRAGGQLHFTYAHAVRGFAATLPTAAVAALQQNPRIALVEQDQTVSLSATQSNATWGLDRVDQRPLPLNGAYAYDYGASGVFAFIIDTGIRASHVDFGGRVQAGYTAIYDGRGTSDCNGHGTHVAGTVAGSTWGVAKSATLVAVRVLNCRGSGTWSGVIAGVDWVTSQTSLRPAVGNMSLGGGASSAVDAAVARAVDAGVTMVVAAGNDSANACNYSPAREPKAITVGSTTSSDVRSSFSNIGTCVDLFAPGSSITSAWYDSNTSTRTISGTSMASPHVAGVAALALYGNGSRTPAQVTQLVTSQATSGVVSSAGTGSPNLLLYSLLDSTSGGTTNSPPVASFTYSCADLKCSFDGGGSSDSDGSIATYSWAFGDVDSASGSTVNDKIYAAGGSYTVTLTVMDDDGATGSNAQTVWVSTSSGGTTDSTLAGVGVNNGGSWTARATLSGAAGASTSGTWSQTNASGGCTIPSDAASCSFQLSGISKKVSSVIYTDSTNGSLSVTIFKP